MMHANAWIQHCARVIVLGIAVGDSAATNAGCTGDEARAGILGIDRCGEFEADGMFSRGNQKLLDAIVNGGTVGKALWEGIQSAQGRTVE
jgi:hypothetical protein